MSVHLEIKKFAENICEITSDRDLGKESSKNNGSLLAELESPTSEESCGCNLKRSLSRNRVTLNYTR